MFNFLNGDIATGMGVAEVDVKLISINAMIDLPRSWIGGNNIVKMVILP